jgi:HK97 gp10 family phage protein
MAKNNMKFDLDIRGVAEVVKKMSALSNKKETDRKLAASMKKAAKPVLAIAKSKVPVDEGHLRSSLAMNTKINKRTGNRNVRIGPDDSSYRSFGNNIDESGTGSISLGKKKKPANYAHLVEFGHEVKNRADGPVIGQVRRTPFLRPAMAREGGAKFVKRLGDDMYKKFKRLVEKKNA